MKNKSAFLLVLLALLPVLLLRDYTVSNELRYLSIADEAIRNHTFFSFSNQGLPYADKPPLYFWLIMLQKWIFGSHQMWFLALMSLLPAFVTVGVMDRWAKDYIFANHRFTGMMMLLSSGVFLVMAVTLRMDMLMTMFIVLALFTFYNMVVLGKWTKGNRLLFPLYIFLALFSKGLVGLFVPIVSSIVFLCVTNRRGLVKRVFGFETLAVLCSLCALWFLAVYLEAGKGYLFDLLFHQTSGRLVNAFHHKEPFYYYFVSIWYVFLPWIFAIVGVIFCGVVQRKIISDVQKFFLTVVTVTIGLLSLSSSKIDVYLLPLAPFIAYLALTLLPVYERSWWLRFALSVPLVALALAFPLFVLCVKGFGMREYSVSWLYMASVAMSVFASCALYSLFCGQQILKPIRLAAYGVFLTLFFGGFALPKINDMIGYRETCQDAKRLTKEFSLQKICTYKVRRSKNMDVFLGNKVEKVSDSTPLDSLASNTLYIVPKKDLHLLPRSNRIREIHKNRKNALVVVK